MNQSKIAVRYAKALFLTARDHQILDLVKTDLILITEVLKQNEAFRNFIFSPVTKPRALRRVIETAFGGGKIEGTTLSFIGLLIKNNRIQFLEETARVFFDIYSKYLGIKSAMLYTVNDLSEKYKLKFQQVLKDIYHSEIDLSVAQKPEIIGGFILRVEDQQYDASIATQLNHLKKVLKNTESSK
jgi:F-type H+-transporting ATPase subunit delta